AMSGSDVRVVCREAGPGSPGPAARMPAWKREILERRKAKGGGAGAGEPGSVSVRAGCDPPAAGKGDSGEKEPGPGARKNFFIASASQLFGSRRSIPAGPELSPLQTNKGAAPRLPTAGGTGRPESLVLQDSLGPLQENPFMKLEKERRRRLDRDSTARPGQHLLELYGNVPGVKTIRADNIIIIESDPEYFPEAGGGKASPGDRLQQNGTVSTYSSLSDLLDRRGSGVTEIRAREVVVYDSALSRSEENLSTLGRPGPEEAGWEAGLAPGRVSRMLQKFDRNYGKLQPKSRSTENLLLDPEPRARPDPLPKTPAPPCPPPAAVFQSPKSSKPEGGGAPAPPAPPPAEPHPPVSSCRRHAAGERGEAGGGPEGAATSPTVPSAPEEGPGAESHSASAAPARQGALSPTFEIRPSPLPDLSALPAGDAQARALANLRLQSRNSFTVVPRRRAVPRAPAAPAPAPLPSLTQEAGADAREGPAEPPKRESGSPPPPSPPPADPCPEDPCADRLPVTNIDDVVASEEETPPALRRRSGNTFTVVPRRTPEPPGPTPAPQPSAAPPQGPQAPYAQLGALLKKRYPAVEEIEVIGGYLSLGRSCLSKTSSTRKKLKISFNESSLQSTFEYPSESSVWESAEEEDREGEDKDGEEGEEDSGSERIFIPRPSYTSSPTHSPNTSTDLSSYTPKHSVDFSAWQEHKLEDSVSLGDPSSRRAELSAEGVMLTPADSSSLSDFSSEPALYF
uniref:Taperin n=1 Tax=Lepisosteus oculatus TaxID=7918 RepID=W5LXB2_LEPOC